MTPEASVAQFAELIRSMPVISEDDVYSAMAANGIPTDVADHAFKFTQVAWGRILLHPLGAAFSPDYLSLNASGQVVESGPLAGNPYYVAAAKIAGQYAGSDGFRALAMMSAETNSINNALNNGSKARDLVLAPVIMFTEPPTETGLYRAHAIIQNHLAGSKIKPAEGSTTKLWWQFWK